jgi:toxin YoeB
LYEKGRVTDLADEDFLFWKQSGNIKIITRIENLIKAIQETPFTGIGKPEPLKYGFAKLWSRRITETDRLIYEVRKDVIIVHSLKGHYQK